MGNAGWHSACNTALDSRKLSHAHSAGDPHIMLREYSRSVMPIVTDTYMICADNIP